MQTRQELTKEILAEWHEYRQTIRHDAHQLERVYAEMTGYMASVNPVAFFEFLNGMRERDRWAAEAEAAARRCPACGSDNTCEQTGADDEPMACLDCGCEWDPDA